MPAGTARRNASVTGIIPCFAEKEKGLKESPGKRFSDAEDHVSRACFFVDVQQSYSAPLDIAADGSIIKTMLVI